MNLGGTQMKVNISTLMQLTNMLPVLRIADLKNQRMILWHMKQQNNEEGLERTVDVDLESIVPTITTTQLSNINEHDYWF